MTPIPARIKEILTRMPRMKRCEMSSISACDGKIEFHHAWIYGGKQIQEVWAIVAVCTRHHDLVKTDRDVRMYLEWVSLQYAVEEELAKYYPRKDWEQIEGYLLKTCAYIK